MTGRFTNATEEKINRADEVITLTLDRDCHNKALKYTSGCFSYVDYSTEWIDERTPARPSPLGEGHTQVLAQLMSLH